MQIHFWMLRQSSPLSLQHRPITQLQTLRIICTINIDAKNTKIQTDLYSCYLLMNQLMPILVSELLHLTQRLWGISIDIHHFVCTTCKMSLIQCSWLTNHELQELYDAKIQHTAASDCITGSNQADSYWEGA